MAAALGRGEGNGRSTALRGVMGSAFSSLSRLRRSTAHDSSAPALEETIAESSVAPPEPELSALPDPSPQPIAPAPVPAPVAQLDAAEPVAEPIAAPVPVAPVSAADTELDLLELARLCADLGCVTSTDETMVLLKEAARILDATGLIVWAWNHGESHLQPVLWHGYPPRVMSQLPMVQRDDDNATAVAFRTAQARVIHDSASGECAFVIPLRTASGCVGALAVELRRGREATKSCIAVATLLAAQLAPIADSLSQPEQLSLPQAVNGAAL
jgi:hypothetical protein